MIDKNNTSKFHLDGKPPLREAIPLGMQHLLAMIVGNMVPAILISNILGLSKEMSIMLLQGAMLAAGIATIIQLYPIPLIKGYKIGAGLPVMMGTSYVFLGACLSVTGQYGIATLIGAQIVSAVVTIFLGIAVKKIRKIFTPVISGTIVACMGIGLFPVAINNLAGGQGSLDFGSSKNFIVGIIVAFIVVIIMHFGKGLVKDVSILIGIVVGYIISLSLGMVDFSAVGESAWFAFPKLLPFGVEFRLDVIIMFTLIYAISIADLMGSYTVVTMGGLNREVTDEELSSGVIGGAVGSIIASLLSSIPTGVFSQNSAIVAMNKVVSRFVIATATVILFIAGISPKIGALITTIPSAVIGGATLVVFSQIAMAGVMLITMEEFTDQNKLIAGVAIATSIGVTSFPQAIEKLPPLVVTLIGDSSIVLGALIALLLQLIFTVTSKKEDIGKQISENS